MTMSKEFKQAFANMETAICAVLDVPKSWLPENYQGRRNHRNLLAVVAQHKKENVELYVDPNEVSVKFNSNGEITKSTPERLARLENYARQIATGDENTQISYDESERLYDKQLVFVGAMEKAGIIKDESEDE